MLGGFNFSYYRYVSTIMSSESSLVFSNVSLCVPKLSSGMSTYSSILISSEVSHTKGENNVLIRVERFGFSTNNITYQALGEIPHFRYAS